MKGLNEGKALMLNNIFSNVYSSQVCIDIIYNKIEIRGKVPLIKEIPSYAF